jgi:hypothetical protein
MKSFTVKTDAVILTVAVFLLASTTTVAVAHAQTKEELLLEAKNQQIAAANVSSLAEVKKLESLLDRQQKPARTLDKYANQREQLTPLELKELLSLVGFEGKALKSAWAIAMKESTGRPKSHNGNSNTGDNSYGLFQINMIGSLGEDRRERFDLKQNSDLWNPVLNAEIAYHMSGGGQDFGAWGIGPNAYNGGKAGSYYEWLAKYPD